MGDEIGFPLESVSYDYTLINTAYEVQEVKNTKATNLMEQLYHQLYLTRQANGELADAQRLYKEKTDAFKKSYKENNSLEILPDEEDDCYDAYRAQLKENCKKEIHKGILAGRLQTAAVSAFEIKKEKLENEIKTFRKLA